MPTTVVTDIRWKRFSAGEGARCMGCQGQVFAKVLPGSVTWLCREPRLTVPPPGGVRYLCTRCRAAHWSFALPEAQGQQPPRVAA